MPFCPECAFEYSADVLVCPECKVNLVDHFPAAIGPAAMTPDDSWVGVCAIGTAPASEVICGLLDSHNIPSMVMSSAFQPLGGVAWMTDPANKNRKNEIVMVPREFRQEAELLLSAVLGDDLDLLDASKQ